MLKAFNLVFGSVTHRTTEDLRFFASVIRCEDHSLHD